MTPPSNTQLPTVLGIYKYQSWDKMLGALLKDSLAINGIPMSEINLAAIDFKLHFNKEYAASCIIELYAGYFMHMIGKLNRDDIVSPNGYNPYEYVRVLSKYLQRGRKCM